MIWHFEISLFSVSISMLVAAAAVSVFVLVILRGQLSISASKGGPPESVVLPLLANAALWTLSNCALLLALWGVLDATVPATRFVLVCAVLNSLALCVIASVYVVQYRLRQRFINAMRTASPTGRVCIHCGYPVGAPSDRRCAECGLSPETHSTNVASRPRVAAFLRALSVALTIATIALLVLPLPFVTTPRDFLLNKWTATSPRGAMTGTVELTGAYVVMSTLATEVHSAPNALTPNVSTLGGTTVVLCRVICGGETAVLYLTDQKVMAADKMPSAMPHPLDRSGCANAILDSLHNQSRSFPESNFADDNVRTAASDACLDLIELAKMQNFWTPLDAPSSTEKKSWTMQSIGAVVALLVVLAGTVLARSQKGTQ
jgi:hypothetical protein